MPRYKINLAQEFSRFPPIVPGQTNQRIAGEVNDCVVKLAKFKGEFVWHAHEREDELFLVVRGQLTIRFRDRDIRLNEGELYIVPRGTEHLPVAEEEVQLLLFEPKSTINTGSVRNERTLGEVERIEGLAE